MLIHLLINYKAVITSSLSLLELKFVMEDCLITYLSKTVPRFTICVESTYVL